jgi:hypothetical protein
MVCEWTAFVFVRTFSREDATNIRPAEEIPSSKSIPSGARPMTRERNRLAQMNEESMPSIPQDKMSYAMITIGTSVGHLAAAIYSALGHGLRTLCG